MIPRPKKQNEEPIIGVGWVTIVTVELGSDALVVQDSTLDGGSQRRPSHS